MIEVNGVTYVVLPGPPSELKPMVWDYLVPCYLVIHKQFIPCFAILWIAESQLVTVLSDLIDNQTDPTIAPYAKTGEVTLRLSTKADDIESAKAKLDQLEQKFFLRRL